MKTIHIGEGSGRGSGRVGSDFLSAIAGRVGSGQRFGGSGRVGSKKSDPWTTLRHAHLNWTEFVSNWTEHLRIAYIYYEIDIGPIIIIFNSRMRYICGWVTVESGEVHGHSLIICYICWCAVCTCTRSSRHIHAYIYDIYRVSLKSKLIQQGWQMNFNSWQPTNGFF